MTILSRIILNYYISITYIQIKPLVLRNNTGLYRLSEPIA